MCVRYIFPTVFMLCPSYIYLRCPPRLHYYYYYYCVCVSVVCLHQLMTFYVWDFFFFFKLCTKFFGSLRLGFFFKNFTRKRYAKSCAVFVATFSRVISFKGELRSVYVVLYCRENGEQFVSILLCFPTVD